MSSQVSICIPGVAQKMMVLVDGLTYCIDEGSNLRAQAWPRR